MKIFKNHFEYLEDMNILYGIAPDISGLSNWICYYEKGRLLAKHKWLHRIAIYDYDYNGIFIFIIGPFVINLSHRYKAETDFVRKYISLFKKSWYNEEPYNTYLNDILDKIINKHYNLKDAEESQIPNRDPHNLYSDDIDEITNNIILENCEIEIELPKCKLIKVTVKNGKVKAHTIFHKKDIQKELDFINEYKDIFEQAIKNNDYWSICDKIKN